MVNRWKKIYLQIAHGEPGRRFMDYHRQRQQAEEGQTWKTPLYLVVGLVLVVAGSLLSLPPGVPGFLLTIPGLALIAARLKNFAQVLDQGERWLRRSLDKLR
jgi:UPF0716 family protein affecting phage T7 exclusion